VDLGLAQAYTGRVDEGRSLVQDGVERARGLGRLGRLSLLVTHLGTVSLLAGQPAQAGQLAREALHLAVTRKERGNQAYALWLLGEIGARAGGSETGLGEEHLRRAIALADELGMRPLRARCLLALRQLARDPGERGPANEPLTEALALLRDMHMTYWLQKLPR
jgi:hypothetical protein